MTFIKSLKENKFKPSIKILIILLIFVMYLVFSYFWSVKSDVYAFDFLPQDTVFYYEWPDKEYFNLNTQKKLDFIDLSEPNKHLLEINGVLANKFLDVQEVVWFKTGQSDEDYYLIRLRSLSDKSVDNLQSSQNEYKFRKVADAVLLLYKNKDLVLPELVSTHFSTNHIKEGNNIYWQLDDEPEFLKELSKNVQPFVNFKELNLNIKENSLNLFQIYNEEQAISDQFSNVLFPQDFDMLLGFRASSTENIGNYLANQIIMPNFDKLPYFNLTQDKFNEYFLKDSFLWQKEENWLLARKLDWWPLVTDLASSLELEERASLLVDGTAYTELVVKENQLTQHFKYLDYDLWQIDTLYGANVDDNFYLSNNRQTLEEIISQKQGLTSLIQNCGPSDNYKILDILWWNSQKLKNEPLRDYLSTKDIDNLKVFTYQNSIIQGINWCF